MHSYTALRYERRAQTAWLTLNRPDAMNALSDALCDELADAIGRIERDRDVRVAVLTGAGRAFCAGADLKGVFEGGTAAPDDEDPLNAFLDRIAGMIDRLRVLPKPTIAALNGLTMAGGLELAMACARKDAEVGVRIGPTAAKYLLFTGDTLPAAELVPLGLVNRVVPDAELAAEVDKLATRIASKSPLVLRRMKQAVADGLDQPQATALRLERLVLDAHRHSHDIREGVAAFVGKRKPEFKGC